MSMFYLEPDVYADDLECPACNMTFVVNWQTEYGEPIYGEHDIECLCCGYEFVMRVSTQVIIDARLKEPKNVN